jgi:hypothetical protein
MSADDDAWSEPFHKVQLLAETTRRLFLSPDNMAMFKSIRTSLPAQMKARYAALSTTRLLELYAEAARRAGAGRGLWNNVKAGRSGIRPPPEEPAAKAEVQQGVAAMLAAGDALLARGAISEMKSLFESDDPDLRLSSAQQFSDVDPETAAAAIHSIFALVSTREMLEMRRRARQAPPGRPTLQEMSDEALLARFEDAATRQGAAQYLETIEKPEDHETQNRVFGETTDTLREVKSRGLEARLMPLLLSDDLTVRWRAAQGCLSLAEEEAVMALETVMASGTLEEAMRARDIFDRWRGKPPFEF